MKITGLIKITSIGVLAISSLSCKKFLKENNPSGLTAESIYSTPAGFETLVNAAYSYTRWWYGKEEGYGMSEMGTDLWTSGEQGILATAGTSNEVKSMVQYDNLQGSNMSIARNWKHLYAAVNLCNTGIKQFEDEGSPEGKRKRVAELKFLRAFYYWHIVETWGAVHFTTEPTTTAVLTANKAPIEKFYELISSDLVYAVANLDATVDLTRASRPAAKAFLARVYLTMGYRDASYYELAKKEASEVIASGSFSLSPSYKDLWIMNKPNREVIWAVNYSTNLAISDNFIKATYPYGYGYESNPSSGTGNRGSNNGHLFFTCRYDIPASAVTLKLLTVSGHWPLERDVNYGTSFNRYMPTKFLLNLFDETKDARYNGSFQTVWLANKAVNASSAVRKFAVGDTALVISKTDQTSSKYFTLNANAFFNPDGSSISYLDNVIYPNLIKFRDSTRNVTSPGNPKEKGSGQVQSSRDVFVLRLAEMYLILAEADVKLGNLDAAVENINKLREKRALPGKTAEMLITVADMQSASPTSDPLDFVLDERAREFAGEQIRWFDLKRTGKLVDRVKRLNPDAGKNIQDIHVVRPIPRTELDAITNKTEFMQNPWV